MKMFISLWFLFSNLAQALYSKKDDVIELTPKNFDLLVSHSNDVWNSLRPGAATGKSIFAQTPWFSKNLAPEYKKAATKLNGLIKLGAVDCDADANKQLCGKYGVQGFPTLKIFTGDSGKKRNTDYGGARTSKDITYTLLAELPSKHIKVVKSMEDIISTMEKNSSTPKAILLHEKKSIPDAYKAISLTLKNRMEMFYVSDKSLVQQMAAFVGKQPDVKLPVLAAVPFGGQPIIYSGEMKAKAIRTFLESHALPGPSSGYQQKSEKKKQPEPPAPKEPFDPKIAEIKDAETFATECTSKPQVSVLCLVAFLPILEPEYKESVAQHESLIKTLSDVKKQLYDKDWRNVYVLWIDGSASLGQSVKNQFRGISDDNPSAVIYAPSKKAYAVFVGGFDSTPLFKFVDTVKSGKGRVFTLASSVEISAPKKQVPLSEALCTEKPKDGAECHSNLKDEL